MELLQLRTNFNSSFSEGIPFGVYTVGTEKQSPLTRLNGFSAKQLLLTFSGTGTFRRLGQDKWDIIKKNTLLYIPDGMPHEYLPKGNEPWHVGFVTFMEREEGWMKGWGFGCEPQTVELKNTGTLYSLLENIWAHAGPHYDGWKSAELFLSFCLELKKQSVDDARGKKDPPEKSNRYPNALADRATRFLHDHLERNFTLSELSSYLGYSTKQTVRLFRQEMGVTPHRYLQQIRLKTAALLLEEHPDITVRQAAVLTGMEPVYFARLFRRTYGVVPSEFRTRRITKLT